MRRGFGKLLVDDRPGDEFANSDLWPLRALSWAYMLQRPGKLIGYLLSAEGQERVDLLWLFEYRQCLSLPSHRISQRLEGFPSIIPYPFLCVIRGQRQNLHPIQAPLRTK